MIGGFSHRGGDEGFPNRDEGCDSGFVSYSFLNRDYDSEVWPRLVLPRFPQTASTVLAKVQ